MDIKPSISGLKEGKKDVDTREETLVIASVIPDHDSLPDDINAALRKTVGKGPRRVENAVRKYFIDKLDVIIEWSFHCQEKAAGGEKTQEEMRESLIKALKKDKGKEMRSKIKKSSGKDCSVRSATPSASISRSKESSPAPKKDKCSAKTKKGTQCKRLGKKEYKGKLYCTVHYKKVSLV